MGNKAGKPKPAPAANNVSSNRVEDMEDVDKKYGEKRKYDPEFRGPIKNRGCTDVICLFLLVAFLVGWGFVAVYGFTNGDPAVLVYPSNSHGEICGWDNTARELDDGKMGLDLTDRKVLLFFDITHCVAGFVTSAGTSALTGCSTTQVCVNHCPNKTMPFTEASKEEFKPYCDPRKFNISLTKTELMNQQICPKWVLNSTSMLGRCMPTITEKGYVPKPLMPEYDALKNAMKALGQFLNLRNFGERVLQDLKTTWWMILISLVAAFIVTFIWIVLMSYIAKCMVWASLLASLGLLIASCVYCTLKYIEIANHTGNDAKQDWNDLINIGITTNVSIYGSLGATWMVFLILSGLILLILLIVLIFMRKSISVAVELINQGARAVRAMMSTLCFPLVPFFLQILAVGWFMAVGMYLASSGERQYMINVECSASAVSQSCKINNQTEQTYSLTKMCSNINDTYKCTDANSKVDGCTAECRFYKFGPTTMANWFQFYNVFGLLWIMCFISALGEMVLAGAFASWYWLLDKSKLRRTPLLASFGRTLFYHTGTLAFGSLIIAIIKVIRMMIEYIEHKLKEKNLDNPFVKCCMCCCRCCFWMLEKFMKFINRNAYIMTAVYGKNFCTSAKDAFFLLMRNIATTFVLDKVTDFLLLIGKIVIVGGAAVTSYIVFGGKVDLKDANPPDINYYFVPILIITVSTYFIADVFFGIFAMAVDTLFLCYLEDLERNDGSAEKPYYMSKELKKIMHKKNKTPPASPEHIPLKDQ